MTAKKPQKQFETVSTLIHMLCTVMCIVSMRIAPHQNK